MFLLRVAFWLTIVVLLIPSDPDTGTEAPRVGIFQALGAARAAVADVSGFCERNPDACATGSSTVKLLELKARYGAKMLQQYLNHDEGKKPAEGTLSTEDMEIPWHQPATRRAA